MSIPKSGHIEAFSIIVDINDFTTLIANSDGNLVADFIRDTLVGSVVIIENAGGDVVGVMGDAIFGVVPDCKSAVNACVMIAKDINMLCKYLAQSPGFLTQSPTLKIGVEFGWLDVTEFSSNAMGTVPFLIGPATNYAARILQAGEGNRCHIGPRAASEGFNEYRLGPVELAPGKRGEPAYQFQKFDLSDIWVEGIPEDGRYYW